MPVQLWTGRGRVAYLSARYRGRSPRGEARVIVPRMSIRDAAHPAASGGVPYTPMTTRDRDWVRTEPRNFEQLLSMSRVSRLPSLSPPTTVQRSSRCVWLGGRFSIVSGRSARVEEETVGAGFAGPAGTVTGTSVDRWARPSETVRVWPQAVMVAAPSRASTNAATALRRMHPMPFRRPLRVPGSTSGTAASGASCRRLPPLQSEHS